MTLNERYAKRLKISRKEAAKQVNAVFSELIEMLKEEETLFKDFFAK